ncbi:protein SLX4IP isoform X2 [Stegastes partitus]|uniref:Protein SLX4IP isoform X2 n=1 Tax=Stegastes partitus TaxID=144197 RepID=A0A9Y4NV13_9TELE|nr:PREDICTED: protein SLX4IP isoform X2 [Stegastes partitus]
MAPIKFVIKCGNFAVLVDLHVVPLGGQEDASWFTTDHIEEVTNLVRDSVDQRVNQYREFLHNRGQPKQKKELAPDSAFFVKDLRVFPERYVVCVSCPEDALAHHRNPSLAATELGEQSRSEYFSSVGETQELLNSSTKTKKAVLQKIAKQASVQRELCGSTMGEQQIDQRDCPKNAIPEDKAGEPKFSLETSSAQKTLPKVDHKVPSSSALTETLAQIGTSQKREQQGEINPPDTLIEVSAGFCQHEITQETKKSKRCKLSDAGEDPHPQRAKRTCLGRPPTTVQTHSTECSTQTSKHDLLPLPPSPLLEAKAESKAFPVSECKKTTLEVELLTPGKRAQRLPLTSNNTAQTNQNRLAASLRGLSVKPASSGSSIGSRSTLGEEGSENVPRTSRLRRLKRS